jgi:hypothetical protein
VGTRNFVCVETENPIMSSLLPSKRPVRLLLKRTRSDEESATVLSDELFDTGPLLSILDAVVNNYEIVIATCYLTEKSFDQIALLMNADDE